MSHSSQNRSQVTGNAFLGGQWRFSLLVFVFAVVPVLSPASDDVEITVTLDWESHSRTKTNRYNRTLTCIVASNGWFISGVTSQNSTTDFWLVGTNVVAHTTITDSMYLQRAKEFVSEKVLRQGPQKEFAGSYPHAGETHTAVHPSALGWRVFSGTVGAVWLAFCSEDFLRSADRQIPVPIGPTDRLFRYSDKTELLDGDSGLPRSVKLFASDGTLFCAYEVLTQTNFLGHTFPMRFRVIQQRVQQRGPGNLGAWTGARSYLLGEVKSITRGKRPALPAEARKKLESTEGAQQPAAADVTGSAAEQ